MAQTTSNVESSPQLMQRWAAALGVGILLLAGCQTASPVPPEAVILSGRINPMLGPQGQVLCWVLEAGSDLRSLKYYVLIGRDELLERIRQEDATVTLRAVIRNDVYTDCPVGTVAEVYEILSLRTPKD